MGEFSAARDKGITWYRSEIAALLTPDRMNSLCKEIKERLFIFPIGQHEFVLFKREEFRIPNNCSADFQTLISNLIRTCVVESLTDLVRDGFHPEVFIEPANDTYVLKITSNFS